MIPFGCAGVDQATRTADELRAVSWGGLNPTGRDSLVVAWTEGPFVQPYKVHAST